MNKLTKILKSRGYFFKKIFRKPKTWIIIMLWLVVLFFLFLVLKKEGGWFFNMEKEFVEQTSGLPPSFRTVFKTIKNINDFFACVFPNLIFLPILLWSFFFAPLSWIFWGEIEETGQKTQEDGTDLFFLSTEIPTSRSQIFWSKVVFLTSFFLSLHLILFALPLSLLLWKVGYFSNFTGLQTFLFLGWNFLATPLLLFAPLVIFLLSLASLKSVWYTILKWFGRLSVIFLIFQTFCFRGEAGKKWGEDFFKWISQNYLLTTLTIMGLVIGLSAFTLLLAYKKYLKRDLK